MRAREAGEFMTGQENKKIFFFFPKPLGLPFLSEEVKEHKVQSYTSLGALTSSVTSSVQIP